MTGTGRHSRSILCAMVVSGLWASAGWGGVDVSTHESDHLADEDVQRLEPVHVHGLELNNDRRLGPVPTYTPWPAIPPALRGRMIDDWMKARILVSRTGDTTVVILEPAKHRQLNMAGVRTLQRWKFDPQKKGDAFVDGALTIRIHFRTQEP